MIPIAKPLLDEREADAVRRVILSGWINQRLKATKRKAKGVGRKAKG
jgi:dTDP-4-amino-4,6-dideoxygalactose transaminase